MTQKKHLLRTQLEKLTSSTCTQTHTEWKTNHREPIQAPQDKGGEDISFSGKGQFEFMEFCTVAGDKPVEK